MMLDTVRRQRKALNRVRRQIHAMMALVEQDTIWLVQDLTAVILQIDKAEERLLTAETRIEDARGRPAA